MQNRFRRIGEVKFNAIAPAKITWEGVTKDVTTFFRKEKRKWGGRGGYGRLVLAQFFLNLELTAPATAIAFSQVQMGWNTDGTLEARPRDPL